MSTCLAISIPTISTPVAGYWAGTGVPYAMHYLKPRHVRALGHSPKHGKTYALRDGCNLVTVRNGYTAHVAEIASLPKLSILHA